MKKRDREMLTIGEVADWLSVSTITVRRLMATGDLPAPLKIGRQLRWPVLVISEWIAALTDATVDDARKRVRSSTEERVKC